MRLIALASLNLRLCVSSILGQITWLTLSKTEAAVNILFCSNSCLLSAVEKINSKERFPKALVTAEKRQPAVNILFLLSISDISTPGRCHRCWENLFQRALHVVGCLPDSVAGLLMSSTVLLLYTAIIVPVQICMWNYDDPCNKFPTLPFDVIVDCFFMV